MSSATVERQHKGSGKALGNILLQCQHTQDCGRGELRGVRKLKADWPPLSPGLLATWQQLGHFSADSCLQWPKSPEAADVGIGSGRGVCDIPAGGLLFWNTGAKIDTEPGEAALLQHPGFKGVDCVTTPQGRPFPASVLFASCQGRGWLSCSQQKPRRFLHCPLHPGAHGTWSCAWLPSCRCAVLPPQTEGRSCMSVKLLRHVRTFCWVTASNLGNFDQRKMTGAWR